MMPGFIFVLVEGRSTIEYNYMQCKTPEGDTSYIVGRLYGEARPKGMPSFALVVGKRVGIFILV